MCKDILLADLLTTQHLLGILQTLLTFKNSEKVVKSGCFKKVFPWREPTLFRYDGGMLSLLCKNIDVSLNY